MVHRDGGVLDLARAFYLGGFEGVVGKADGKRRRRGERRSRQRDLGLDGHRCMERGTWGGVCLGRGNWLKVNRRSSKRQEKQINRSLRKESKWNAECSTISLVTNNYLQTKKGFELSVELIIFLQGLLSVEC